MNVAVVVATALALVGAAPDRQGTIAVLAVTGSAPASIRQELTSELRSASAALGFDVDSGADTDAIIAGARGLGADCPLTSDTCVLQLAGLTGARLVVVGALDGDALVVRSFNVGLSRQVSSARVPLLSSAAQTARLAALRVLRPDLELGQLTVDVDVDGATIVVDNVNHGISPMATLTLSPGRHEVYVAHADFDSQTHHVDVAYGTTASLQVRLDSRMDTDRGRRARPTVGADDVFRRIAVLDVQVQGHPPLTSSLSTMALLEEIQKLDNVIAIGPAELSGLMGPGGVSALRACRDVACQTAAVSAAVAVDDIVLVDVHQVAPHTMVLASRIHVATSVRLQRAEIALADDAEGAAIGEAMVNVVSRLYPVARRRPGKLAGLSSSLRRRFEPPPIPLLGWVASAAIAPVGVAVGVVGAIGYQRAIDQDQSIKLPATLLVTGAAIAGFGLALVIIEVPYVDWRGAAAANAALQRE